MLGPKGPVCQSCGMPLSKDKNGGGTNADGSINTKYCSYCYQNGAFTNPNITLEEMKTKCVGIMKTDMKIPTFIGKLLVSKMGELERWKK